MKLQIPLWLATICALISVWWFFDFRKYHTPIPFEPPAANQNIILLLTNRECFRLDGERTILMFNLTAQEWNTIKRFKKPSTNGWLWLTK